MSDIQISPLPQVNSQRQTVLDRPAAQRQDYGFMPADDGSELRGLVNGLATLNPALQQYTDQAVQAQHRADDELASAEGQRAKDPAQALKDINGAPLPASVPPAFGEAYRHTLKGVLGERAGAAIVSDIAREYNDAKDQPGFNAEQFITDARARHLNGFDDPLAAGQIGRHVSSIEASIRSDAEKTRMQRQAETTDSALSELVRSHLDPTMPPEELLMAYQNHVLPAVVGVNKSPKDAAALLFARVNELSNQLGGAPQLYSVFDMKDGQGMTLSSRNPGLSAQIDAARQHADQMLSGQMVADGQVNRFKALAALDQERAANPESITPERLSSMIGQFNVFTSVEGAHAYLMAADAEKLKRAGLAQLQSSWTAGNVWQLPPEQQQQLAEANLGQYMNRFAEVARTGNPTDTAKLADALVKEISHRGFSVPLAPMARFIETLTTTLPSKEGPDNGFLARAELYKAMAADPKQRALYFKDDTDQLMSDYTKMVGTGTDPKAAYTSAYAGISKEAKAAAEQMAKDPAFNKAARGAVDQVIGSSFWPQWLGGNGRPNNADTVEADARAAMMDFKRHHPNASSDDVSKFAKGYVEGNWVHDSTTGNVVKVPPQMATQATQESLSEFSKRLMDAKRLNDRSDSHWSVEYEPAGAQGDMTVYMTNGMGSRSPLARVNLGELTRTMQNEKLIGPTDGTILREVQRQVSSGQVDPAFMQANAATISKGRMLKALPASTVQAIDRMTSMAMLQRLQSVPAMAFGAPDYSTLPTIPQRGSVKVDNKATSQIAQQFALSPVVGDGSGHMGLAASLVTMGEGVVTQATPDPALGAGNNIGSGYNLKANAANVVSDLRRAKVPDDQIQGVVDGTRQLTQDQVMRLTQVTLPRYETLARDTAEKTAQGLWARMTAPQRAVMIDVAYQVGDVGQFKRAWDALGKGDAAAFAQEAQTSYVNRAGERVTDKRRNSLRAAMLEGLPQWAAVIGKYGSLPSNPLDVAAMNNVGQ